MLRLGEGNIRHIQVWSAFLKAHFYDDVRRGRVSDSSVTLLFPLRFTKCHPIVSDLVKVASGVSFDAIASSNRVKGTVRCQ